MSRSCGERANAGIRRRNGAGNLFGKNGNGKLKSELDNLQRLVDRIPPEVLAELKRQRRHTVKER